MAVVIKEDKRVDTSMKTYLERYQEFIGGYKQYKNEKVASTSNTQKPKSTVK